MALGYTVMFDSSSVKEVKPGVFGDDYGLLEYLGIIAITALL
jgi:hypothetical protein